MNNEKMKKEINRLLQSFFFPAHCRAKNRHNVIPPVSLLLNKYNILSVSELYLFNLLKFVAKLLYLDNSITNFSNWFIIFVRNRKYVPSLVVPTKKSKSSNNSPQLRAIGAWNKLPRNFCVDSTTDLKTTPSYWHVLRSLKDYVISLPS